MMDETAASSGAHAHEPVINVIEEDPPPIPHLQCGAAVAQRFDQTAADALAARRRRDFDAVRVRLRDQPIHSGAPWQAAEQQPASQAAPRGSGDAPATRWAPLATPPERVRKRYLRAGNQFFLKDAPHQLAFEDIGPCLVTEHNRPDVVESMVDMARAKAWGRIRVSGHEQFRREVWVQATLLGIEVSGYEPKAVDFARLAAGRRDRMTNRIDVMETTATAPARANRQEAPEGAPDAMESQAAQPGRRDAPGQPEVRAPAPPARAAPPANAAASETGPRIAESERQERQRYVGELVEHGSAPYQHNPARSDSYYVVYRDAGGADQVVWGVDLERAVADCGALAGQQVMLENLGRRLVTVAVPVLDAVGNLIGEEEKVVYRNAWQVDVVREERTQLDPGAHGRIEGAGSGETAAREIPEHAQTHTTRRREPSVVSPGARAVHMAVLTAAMRQQGFSERSIARVQQHAQRLLCAFWAEGVTVPRPRVFDSEAPSARSRRIRTAAQRVPTREVERGPSEPTPPFL